MDIQLVRSQDIINQAIADYQPYAIVMMISGGHDSLLAYHVARVLGVPLTHFMHGVTRTGIQDTTDFARRVAEQSGLAYLEADAGDSYERYVLRKGFYGIGRMAHNIAYHTLKKQHFQSTLSRHIRQAKRGRNILLINGARSQESTNRKSLMMNSVRPDGPNIWVSLVKDWSAIERNEFLSGYRRNPVYDILHKSGECLCGTMQSQEQRREASYWFPSWGNWLDDLEKRVCERFCWKWGEDIPPHVKAEKSWQKQVSNGQMWLPMCQSCNLERSLE